MIALPVSISGGTGGPLPLPSAPGSCCGELRGGSESTCNTITWLFLSSSSVSIYVCLEFDGHFHSNIGSPCQNLTWHKWHMLYNVLNAISVTRFSQCCVTFYLDECRLLERRRTGGGINSRKKNWLTHLPSVLKTIGRLLYFFPLQTAVTVSWYCVSGDRPNKVTASEFPATTATTL